MDKGQIKPREHVHQGKEILLPRSLTCKTKETGSNTLTSKEFGNGGPSEYADEENARKKQKKYKIIF